jgi:hypothetical protein
MPLAVYLARVHENKREKEGERKMGRGNKTQIKGDR